MGVFERYFLLVILLTASVLSQAMVHNVLDYGARGDGETDDTKALAKAWEATCKASSSSPVTMHLPANRTFFTQPLLFKGPCSPHKVRVEIDGILSAPTNPAEWMCGSGHDVKDCKSWIRFSHINGLSISGSGTISGRGQKWWTLSAKTEKPAAVRVTNCNDVRVTGLKFKNNPKMHLVFDDVNLLHVSNLNIEAPANSRNTDGIHLGKCTAVNISNCMIGTGDDCISISGGSSNITIQDIACGPGHGVSIGSLGKHGAMDRVEHIRVSNVVFTKTTNGARIKTWQGGKGYARDIVFERIISQESDNPIIIDQYYCDHETCANSDSAVKISDITFRQVIGTSKKVRAVEINCNAKVRCDNIILEDIHLTTHVHGKKASTVCSNANVKVKGQMFPRIPSHK